MITPADLTRVSVIPFLQEDPWLLITFTGPVPALILSRDPVSFGCVISIIDIIKFSRSVLWL